ncbi:hypothetical protein [Falsigemmobacter faecalis]|uniref:Type I secretion protein n=1 Tax=Falsigemmobacter faecalis TaxID=2488730 RepID=A0A3P3D382_9RHOB|nr:hypothetical protein [Falsigemmobacter faecalis]RRH68860.1 hypothetical protein EG244_19150 [Falsigemmobacter faecalis]
MPADWISQTIAHFIGSMHPGIEGARAREIYDRFQRSEDAPEPGETNPEATLRLAAPHQLQGFDPGITGAVLPDFLSKTEVTIDPVPLLPVDKVRLPRMEQELRDTPAVPPLRLPVPGEPLIPFPAQIATVTWQQLRLNDNDILISGEGPSIFGPSQAAEVFDALREQATALSLPVVAGLPALHLAFLSVEDSLSLTLSVKALEDIPADSGVQSLRHVFVAGAETETLSTEVILSNHTAVGALPLLRELASDSWQEIFGWDEETEEDPAAEEPDPWGGLPAPAGLPPEGHHLSTGGNLASNEAIIVTNGPDATLMVVGGNMIRLDLISQTAVLQTSGSPGGDGSRLINAAQMERGFIATEDLAAAVGPMLPTGQVPSNWHLVRLEGDLTFVNRIEQHIFATDFDHFEAVLTAQSSQIVMGENYLTNLTTIEAFSSHYDIIIIAGDMVSMNLIEQIAVLYDADLLAGWGLAAVEGGGNLLFNSAKISHASMDQALAMTEGMAGGLDALADGGSLAAQALSGMAYFGDAPVSVLYVTGDFIEQNIIRQVTHLGDSDQLALARTEVGSLMSGPGMTVESGGNLLVNAAAIIDLGRDSQIMVAGETYSDAIIYQAGLLDGAAPPAGVLLPPTGDLTAAAVAFLSGAAGEASDSLHEGGQEALAALPPPSPEEMSLFLV